MDITDLLTQLLQYILGILPGNIASNIVIVISLMITLSTFALRLWKEPSVNSKWHWLWKVIHLLAALKLPQKQQEPVDHAKPQQETSNQPVTNPTESKHEQPTS